MIFSLKSKALRLESTNQTSLFHTNTKPQSEARADGAKRQYRRSYQIESDSLKQILENETQ
ncbi:hypothetical protein [Helicobacter cinaedi]|uniref:hypothetical protein n=1 Tax=Helicobacter cinaedi TaxID=213 RepID=UPI00131534C1|nr:hypothetical protein [Helicobacter cinaedi]